jgi:hypothetical protein
MPKYKVITEMTVEADDPKQAAMKVFALHDTMTPEDYRVFEATAHKAPLPFFEDHLLEHDDKIEARRAYKAGEYFPEVNISDIKL